MASGIAERFWAKVSVGPGCWLWTGATTSGYGSLGIRGASLKAHRVAWSMSNGREVPEGMDVCHTCDTPLCVRPSHLFLGTRADNNRDRAAKGRSAMGATHGTHTHPEVYRGSRQPRAILREEEVRLIRSLADTDAITSIHREFGVSRDTVRSILSGKSWGWLP